MINSAVAPRKIDTEPSTITAVETQNRRIVSLAPSNTEIIYSLGAEDRLVGTTSLCDYPEQALELESVGGWINPDTDKIENIGPDLVLASDDLQDRAVDDLRQRGINVTQFSPKTVEEVFNTILKIGEVLDSEDEAEESVSKFRKRLDGIDLQEKRIYCEEWMNPPMVSGNWVPGLIKRANGRYPIEEGKRSRETDLEKLKKFDPEFIFLNVCGAGEGAAADKLRKRENWQDINAVKNGNVYVVDDALLNRPGPRLVEGLQKMESFL